MINNATTVNLSGDVTTRSGAHVKVSRHLASTQSAAMDAALMIGGQYSQESKSKFRRECLSHLKASLAPAQDVFA